MTFDELFDSLPADGWLTKAEAELLLDVAGRAEGPILEVGCYFGRSTVLLASLGRPVYSVDPFDGFNDTLTGDQVEESWRANLFLRGIENVTLFRERIEDWRPRLVGFAYLDGDHTFSGTVGQIQMARRCGTHEFCVHDYEHQGGGVQIVRAIRHSPGVVVVNVAERLAHCRFG